MPPWYVSWLESALRPINFYLLQKQTNKKPEGWVSSTSASYWLVLLTYSCTFIPIIPAYQKLGDLKPNRLKYTIQEMLYIQYRKQTHFDHKKVACGICLDFSKSTSQLILAQVIYEGREIKISVRLVLTQMILQPFLKLPSLKAEKMERN